MLTRYPRLAAWVLVALLLCLGTLVALQARHLLEPRTPDHLSHVQGIIVAVRPTGDFAVRVSGQSGAAAVRWFHAAPGASISLAHIRRHLAERASTDVYYQSQPSGPALAWVAD